MLFVLIIVLIAIIIWQRYYNFVNNHSKSIQQLRELNKQITFLEIQNCDMNHRYDNEVCFNNVSPKDYLTYQLVYIKNEVLEAIENAEKNKVNFESYVAKIKQCIPGEYDTISIPKIRILLDYIENNIFNSLMKSPIIEFKILVKLYQTSVNGKYYRNSKKQLFSAEEIKEIINCLSHKRGDFYLDDEIWQSICRVERGKVSYKMRFSIFERDGYRCRKCGSNYELEIDHIFPISKGGKSTYDNLQTLCHDCNSKKSNIIEAGVANPRTRQKQTKEICPNCGVNLIIKDGRYGDFYACPNYPKCKFTKQMK